MGALGVALIAGALAGVLKWTKSLPRLRLVAALLAGCSLTATGFGAGVVDMVAGFGTVALIVLLIITLGVAAADLIKDKKADWVALGAAVILPLMLVAMGGAVGTLGGEAVRGVNEGTSSGVSSLFGG